MCEKIKNVKTIVGTIVNPDHKYKRERNIYECNDCKNQTFNTSKNVGHLRCLWCGNKYYPGIKFINNSEIIRIFYTHRKYLEIRCFCGEIYTIRSDAGQRSLLNGVASCCKKCNSKRISEKGSISTKDTVIKNVYNMYYINAGLRNRQFNITYDEFVNLIFGICHYCGASGKFYKKRFSKKHNIKRVGIDRIDNNKGYSLENCVSCCQTCNRMKGSLTYEEFTKKILEINNYFTARLK